MFKSIFKYLRIYFCIIGILLFSVNAAAFPVDTYAKNSKLSSGKWVKVKITEDGIYQITKSDISKWGFSNIDNIRVFGYGGEAISDVMSKDNFIDDLPQVPVIRTNAGILFYGKAQLQWKRVSSGSSNSITYQQYQHPYSTYGCYFITENAEIPELKYLKSKVNPTSEAPQTTFIERVFHEKELFSPGMTGRLLLGEDFKYSSSQNFKFNLTGIVPNSKVYAKTVFMAKVMSGSSSVRFSYNNTPCETSSFDNIRPVTSPAYEHVKVMESTKIFELSDPNLNYNLSYKYSGTLFTARLDYITINYTRELSLPAKSLFFRGNSTNYAIVNANSSTMVLDITDTNELVEMNLVLTGNTAKFRSPRRGFCEFIAFNTNSTYPAPEFAETVTNQDLHSLETPDMLIITPPEFRSQAQRIADLHTEKDSMLVHVVVPNDIYNEFSSGTPDVNAYRKLAKMFWDRGNEADSSRQFKYLLLFGRSSYDNRQITEKVKKASYPMLLNWESYVGDNENTSYNTDDILSFLEDGSGQSFGRDKICIGIGRMPVKTVDEAKTAVDKLITYVENENKGSWKNNILIIADDEDNATHMIQSEAVIKKMKNNGGENYMYNHVYQDAFTAVSAGAGRTYPEARKTMFARLSEGTLWANYVGHANPVGWSHDGLLTLTDINENLFYNNLPLLYTATCEFTRWDSDNVSGGELMFLNPRGGVIATMSTSRVVYISDNGILAGYVGAQVFKRDKDGNFQRLGDILKNGKNTYSSINENKLRYSLTGDPAMRLNYPKYTVNLEKVNGIVPTEENQPQLQARSIVEIEGTITDEKGNKANDFNGIISPKLYDAEVSVETHGYGEEGVEYIYYDRSQKLYIGQDSVTNGSFKIKFNMPSEISNNWSPALFNFYAHNGKDIEANGSNENIYVYGYNEDAVTDTIPPTIEYFVLNSSTFQDGDAVNESPMVMAAFSDASGINVSTAGIGHQMTLTLDDKINYNDVTNFYTPASAGELSGGSINYPLEGLSNGHHKLRLKVWDNANISNEQTITFNVVNGLAPELYEVYTNANPASVEANFYLKHNRPDALITVTIEVFNLMGRPVWSSTETGKSDMFTSFPIKWNLCDNAGRRVSRGIYLYRATISTDGIQESTKSKKIAVSAE